MDALATLATLVTNNNNEEVPNDPGKMFIGGLSWQTTPDSLREYFSTYGEVKEATVMKDPNTLRSRGFGFVTYKDPASVDKVTAQSHHELDGKRIDPKVAFPRRSIPKMVTKTKKIFVGGLSAATTIDDLKAYFGQFGGVEDAMLMMDKQTQRHRGFGFVSFDTEDAVERICEIHFHEINGKMAEVKKAQPKEVMLSANIAKAALSGALSSPVGLYGDLLSAATYPQQNHLLTAAALAQRLPPATQHSYGLTNAAAAAAAANSAAAAAAAAGYVPAYNGLGGLSNLGGLGGLSNLGGLGNLGVGLLSPTGSSASADGLSGGSGSGGVGSSASSAADRSLLAQYGYAPGGTASPAASPLVAANAIHNAAALMNMANALANNANNNNTTPQQQQQQQSIQQQSQHHHHHQQQHHASNGLSTSPLHHRTSASPAPRALTAASPAPNGYLSANSPTPGLVGSRPLIQANFTNIYHQGN